jgi:hypothetical protein
LGIVARSVEDAVAQWFAVKPQWFEDVKWLHGLKMRWLFIPKMYIGSVQDAVLYEDV